MKAISYIILVFTLAFISGCQSDVDFHGKEPAPRMVLNSMIDCNDISHIIKVSESVFTLSNQKPKSIDNPNLVLKINDLLVPTTFDHKEKENNYYKFDARLKSGDRIEISGYSEPYGHVDGVDIVPNSPQILKATPEWFTGVEDGISYLRTKITIKDRPDGDNFYRIVIHSKTIFPENDPNDIDWSNMEVYVDQEILFKDVSGVLGETNTSLFAIFANELFRGQEYTLNVYIRYDNFNMLDAEQYVKVEIQSLSANLYKYMRSLELASNEDHFSEPVKIFSNIKGGFGVLGTYTTDQKIIEVQ